MRNALCLLLCCGLAALAADGPRSGLDAARLARIPARMKAFVDDGTVDTFFQVMSMTKPVTGTAILTLAEEGKLRLNDPVEKQQPLCSTVGRMGASGCCRALRWKS